MVFEVEKVRSLSQAYQAAGLGGTWAGGFLASLAAEGKPPRGNGVNILCDLDPLLRALPGRPGLGRSLHEEIAEDVHPVSAGRLALGCE